LRGIIGAFSLVVVGASLGMLTHRFVLADHRFVERPSAVAHEAGRPHEVIADFSGAAEHLAVGSAFREVLQLD
ncbi:MAG: hypothetical protein GTO30_05505, partial [Acidobacteria bacterium]|nr:hypothetical protein [Acidobacteriota bacterium]NIQ87230.1 hypothetical protein [Acidobacteriota bacterium]